jgi:hypothetical protein
MSGEKSDVETRVRALIYNLWGPRSDGSLTCPDERCQISMREATRVRMCNLTVLTPEPHSSGCKESLSDASH